MEIVVEQEQLTCINMIYSYDKKIYNTFVLNDKLDVIVTKSSQRIPSILKIINGLKDNQYIVVVCNDQDTHSNWILKLLKIEDTPNKYWTYLAKKINNTITVISYNTSDDPLKNKISWSPSMLSKINVNVPQKRRRNRTIKSTSISRTIDIFNNVANLPLANLPLANLPVANVPVVKRTILFVSIGMSPIDRLCLQSIATKLEVDIMHYKDWLSASIATRTKENHIFVCFTKHHIIKKDIISHLTNASNKCDILYLANAHNGRKGWISSDKFNNLSNNAIAIKTIPENIEHNCGCGYIGVNHFALNTKNKKHKADYIYPSLSLVTSIIYVSEWKHENTALISINSMFAQSYPQSNMEIIIILDPELNNKKVTKTVFELEDIVKKKKNVKLIINSEHKGFNISIESTIKIAKGERIVVSTGNTVSVKNRITNDLLIKESCISSVFESIESNKHILDKLSYQLNPKFVQSESNNCIDDLLTITKNTLYNKSNAFKSEEIAGYFVNTLR
jgi:hypothetical protein